MILIIETLFIILTLALVNQSWLLQAFNDVVNAIGSNSRKIAEIVL